MKYLNLWCKSRPDHVQSLAKTFIPQIESVWHAYNAMIDGSLFEDLTDQERYISSSHWLRFYRKPKQYFKDVSSLMLGNSLLDDLKQRFEDVMQNVFVNEVEKLEELGESGGELAVKQYVMNKPEILEISEQIAACQLENTQRDIDECDNDQWLLMMFNTAVHVPCMALYGKLHFNLYRQARQGDIQALDDLLRLDKGALRDHLIANHVHFLLLSHDDTKRKIISDAIAGQPIKELTVKRLKIHVATKISVVAKQWGHKVDSMDLLALFDAVARDCDGVRKDPDMPRNADALTKAMQRHRPVVESYFKQFEKLNLSM